MLGSGVGNTQKWRPKLGFVLGGGLVGTLLLSFVGLVALRYLGPEIGFKNAATLLATIILLATAFLGWLLVRLLLRPIQALERYAADTRKTTDRDIQPPHHSGTKELHNMGQSVIEMATELRNREATIRSFTDHVSHEIKTPVSAIRAASELLEDGDTLNASDREILNQIMGAARQIETQLASLREVARARETRHHGHSDLRDLEGWIDQQHPALSVDLTGADVAIPLDPEGLKILITHLAQNAFAHGALALQIAARQTKNRIEISICDDGSGISPGNAAQIFDPFFTTRRTQGGTGMGLTILRNMLAAHGAQISLVSPKSVATSVRDPNANLAQNCLQGACFLVRFY